MVSRNKAGHFKIFPFDYFITVHFLSYMPLTLSVLWTSVFQGRAFVDFHSHYLLETAACAVYFFFVEKRGYRENFMARI